MTNGAIFQIKAQESESMNFLKIPILFSSGEGEFTVCIYYWRWAVFALLFYLWAAHCNAQDLLLTLYSDIIPVVLRRSYIVLGIELRLVVCRASILTSFPSLSLWIILSISIYLSSIISLECFRGIVSCLQSLLPHSSNHRILVSFYQSLLDPLTYHPSLASPPPVAILW